MALEVLELEQRPLLEDFPCAIRASVRAPGIKGLLHTTTTTTATATATATT